MDRLIDALEVELDPAKRKTLWEAAQRLYATELPSLPLYFRADVFVLPKWLSGLRPTGNQYPSTLWITDWARGRDAPADRTAEIRITHRHSGAPQRGEPGTHIPEASVHGFRVRSRWPRPGMTPVLRNGPQAAER